MTATRAWILGLVLVTAGLAGCIGGDDDGEPVDPTTEDEVDPGDEQATANESEASSVERTWENQTFEGEITGFNAMVLAGTNGDNMQTFNAGSGIDVLFLNLTAEGGAVQMTIGGPDCDVSQTQTPACAQTVSTEGGEASYTNETPTPGEWQVSLSVADPAGAQVAYTLEVLQGLDAVAEQ